MAQGYERKDNRPKCVLRVFGPRIIMWRIFLLTFVLLSSFCISNAPFSAGILSRLSFSSCLFFFLLAFGFSCLCFSCICTFSHSTGWVQYFSSEHQNLIVYDLERTLLVLASSVEDDPWSRLMKEIIRLKRGQLADNFKSVKG